MAFNLKYHILFIHACVCVWEGVGKINDLNAVWAAKSPVISKHHREGENQMQECLTFYSMSLSFIPTKLTE